MTGTGADRVARKGLPRLLVTGVTRWAPSLPLKTGYQVRGPEGPSGAWGLPSASQNTPQGPGTEAHRQGACPGPAPPLTFRSPRGRPQRLGLAWAPAGVWPPLSAPPAGILVASWKEGSRAGLRVTSRQPAAGLEEAGPLAQ